MSMPNIKGYCPGALRPMMSGDGLVVRVRPFLGRLEADQVQGIATLAAAHGNGKIDLSSRANLQIRGVRENHYAALVAGLDALALLDADADTESRRNILVTPFWVSGEGTEMLATALTDTLQRADTLALPGKFGFAVDTGVAPVLQSASADIRFERDAEGGLLLCAEGADFAKPVPPDEAVAEALQLAKWFAAQGGGHKRMAALLASGAALPDGFTHPRQIQCYQPVPKQTARGALVGVAFGQMTADSLKALAATGALRLTPWRMLLAEGAQSDPKVEGMLTDPADPLLRVIACTGAPDCAQALSPTRPMAAQLAAALPKDQVLHISGCAKGCAHPKMATRTVVATQQGFDLVKDGRASDLPFASFTTLNDLKKAL